MKHAVLVKTGGPDSIQIQETEKPAPANKEITIKVDHAGVAFADVMMRHGIYPGAPKMPFTPGYDVCGSISEIGSGVSGFSIGEKVIALTQFGGYAQYASVHYKRAIKVPDNINTAEAVTLVLNHISAYQMLTKYKKLRPGNTVLIHSAAGGVGTAATQIARSMGLKTYGTCSTSKINIVKNLGATPIDYKKEDFVTRTRELEPQGVDFVLDPIGGEHWVQSRKVLKSQGTLVGFGFFSLFDHDRPIGSFMDAGRIILSLMIKTWIPGLKKFHLYSIQPKNHKAVQKSLREVLEMYNNGDIKPIIGKEYKLNEVSKAHEELANSKAHGKLILNCKDPA